MKENFYKTLPSFSRYAIFQTGGKQYQAIEGKTIAIEKIDEAVGTTITFDQVLLLKRNNEDVQIGQPFVGNTIKAEIIRQDKGPKVISFLFKRRKKVRVKKGHRQPITVIRVISVEA